MTYRQLSRPDTYYEDLSGYSLRYVQNAFCAPVKHGLAWQAWQAWHGMSMVDMPCQTISYHAMP